MRRWRVISAGTTRFDYCTREITQDRLIRVDAKGELEMLELETDVYAFSISGAFFATLKVALLTAKEYLLIMSGLREIKVSSPIGRILTPVLFN